MQVPLFISAVVFAFLNCGTMREVAAAQPPLRILVMDPLAGQLSCNCVDGVGMRKYARLGAYLEKKLRRPTKMLYDESLPTAYRRFGRDVHAIIGKSSVIEVDLRSTNTKAYPIARLTDQIGRTDLRGAFVVQSGSEFKAVADLKGKTVCLGPREDAECNSAAHAELKRSGITNDGAGIRTMRSVEEAVFAVADGEADAAVIPDYMQPLLEGCGKIQLGSMRSVGFTSPVIGVTVYATASLADDEVDSLWSALTTVAEDKQLLKALESRSGFVDVSLRLHGLKPSVAGASPYVFGNAVRRVVQPLKQDSSSWPDWRGPRRLGVSGDVPQSLPEQSVLWTAELTGPAMAGVAVAEGHIIVPDKDAAHQNDIIRCFDTGSGRPIWTLTYRAHKHIDYTNAPRACPVMHDGLVYIQGAWGDLYCIEYSTGLVQWYRNIVTDFDAKPLTWGSSSPPLVVDDKLIVNPGAKAASLVALDCKTGKVVWKSPGHASGYSAFIVGKFGGRRQIVGFDVAGLGGWDVANGRRLWEIVPKGRADFHVGTPVAIDGKILVATENNATRLYEFDQNGRAKAKPIAVNEDFAPDTCTPVCIGGRVFGTAFGELFCLDVKQRLRTVWSKLDDLYYDHTNLIAGNGRVLIWTTTGDLVLLRADANGYEVVSRQRPFKGDKVETMSHPAIVGNRLYVRSENRLICLVMK